MSDGAINAVLYHDTWGAVVLVSLMLATGFIGLGMLNVAKLLRARR